MGLIDLLKKIPTGNELKGGMGEQLTKLMAKCVVFFGSGNTL